VLPQGRTTKRGTTAINYAEDGYEDDDDDSEARRPTGLRSLQRNDSNLAKPLDKELGKELFQPVNMQGIWREWMGRSRRT
jgi:chromatin structure-remodeling complex subunit SFH1